MQRRPPAACGLAVLFLVAVGCAGSGGGTPTAPTPVVLSGPSATIDAFGNPQVTLRSDNSGVTQTFVVKVSGLYLVEFPVDAGTDDDCMFSLVLTHANNGPAVQSTWVMMPGDAQAFGNVIWPIGAGSYVLQEDETGAGNCHRSYAATVTAEH